MTKRPTPEQSLKHSVIALLDLLENQGILTYQKNNTGAIPIARRRFLRFGRPGAPDIYIFCKGGTTVHCELKAPKGRQSDTQKDWQKRVEALGHKYVLVRSLQDLAFLAKNKFISRGFNGI